MKTLLLYGNENDSLLLNKLYAHLKDYCNIAIYKKSQIIQQCDDLQIQFIESNDTVKIDAENVAVFLKEKANTRSFKAISEKSIVIINSENKKHRQFASKFKVNAVSYGFSSKDTVTFSSRDDDHFVVSLQRTVYAVDGSIIEPMEIPCQIKGEFSDIFILAFVTILIILNEIHLSEKECLLIDA